MRFLSTVLVVAAFLGCAREQPDHTHLWAESTQQHVWTYLPVTNLSSRSGVMIDGGFLKRRLLPGDALTLSNGVTISFDGSAIRIRDTVLPTIIHNCVVDRDGTMRANAFIRTFD